MLNNTIEKTLDVIQLLTDKLSGLSQNVNTNSLLSTQIQQLNNKIDYLSGLLSGNPTQIIDVQQPSGSTGNNYRVISQSVYNNNPDGWLFTPNGDTLNNKPVYTYEDKVLVLIKMYEDYYYWAFISNSDYIRIKNGDSQDAIIIDGAYDTAIGLNNNTLDPDQVNWEGDIIITKE